MITKIILISLFCNGINKSFQDRMLLSWFKKWLNYHVTTEFILMPISNCIYCFASFWGSIAYVLLSFAMQFEISVFEWIICCICAIPLNGVIWNYLEKSEND